jgi:hypothetical protein
MEHQERKFLLQKELNNFMNYLTNYYKNLCEQLQKKISVLEKSLNESGPTFTNVATLTDEQEKANKRAEHILRHGPAILYELMTGKNSLLFGGLPKEEQQLFETRHGTAREVYSDEKFMAELPSHPTKRNQSIVREIARRGDMGLNDAEHARISHEYAIYNVPDELK